MFLASPWVRPLRCWVRESLAVDRRSGERALTHVLAACTAFNGSRCGTEPVDARREDPRNVRERDRRLPRRTRGTQEVHLGAASRNHRRDRSGCRGRHLLWRASVQASWEGHSWVRRVQGPPQLPSAQRVGGAPTRENRDEFADRNIVELREGLPGDLLDGPCRHDGQETRLRPLNAGNRVSQDPTPARSHSLRSDSA